MATNKTINPTNVTVQIPAMADKPNQSVTSNCIDKTIDGVNALDKKMYDLTATATGTVDGNVDAVIKAVRTHMKTNNLNEGTFRVVIGTVNSPMVTAQRWASGNRIIGIVTYAYDTVYSFRINENDETIVKEQLAIKENCGNANSSNSLVVSMNNNERSIIVGIASHERRSFMVLAYVSGSGAVTIVEINKGNNITITTGTNTMTIANSDAQDSYVFKLVM